MTVAAKGGGMARQSRRSAYFEAVGLMPARRTATQRQSAALDRAYELRTFEIGLVWTRATYFFTVQAAVFAAFGLTAKAEGGLPPLIPAMLTLLGLATAWLGFLSARGARFWQQNWEHHIDLLEHELEGDLHKTIVHDGAIEYSVSRAQIGLTFVLVMFWSATAGVAAVWTIRSYWPDVAFLKAWSGCVLLTVALFTALDVSRRKLTSKIAGKTIPLGMLGPMEVTGREKRYVIVERYSAAD